MKKENRITTTAITVALVTLLSSLAGIVANFVSSTSIPTTGILSYFWILLVVVSVALGIFFIFQTLQERQANASDNNKFTTVTKDITIRFNLRDEPVTIEASDAKSAIEAFQGIHENIMKHENLLKAESYVTMEEIKPEASEVPDTKETEG